MPDRGEQLAELLDQALARAEGERADFVRRVANGDASLQRELESLLAAHHQSGEFFDKLAAQIVAPGVAAMTSTMDRIASATLATELSGALRDRYRIDRELGGGMSRVFLAHEVQLGRAVVIKVLPPELSASMSAEPFDREIQLAAQLQHPHIVPVLTSDWAGRLRYFTMPFVDGESLRARLKREGALPLRDALTIWRDILEALAYAHARGVVHRDIKPANILLSARSAMVTDFGVAHAIEAATGAATSAHNGVVGTPAYMAPEQLGSASDTRADLYSAGLVMYEMLTGTHAFAATTPDEMVAARDAARHHPLEHPDISSSLRSLVLQCLARDPKTRPQSAEDVLADLDAMSSTRDDGPARRRVSLVAGITAVVLVGAAMLALWKRDVPAVSSVGTGARRVSSTKSVAAHELYIRGRDPVLLRTADGRRQATDLLQGALAADPNFAAAHTALAWIYLQDAGARPGTYLEGFARAEESARTALRLDSLLPESYSALGWSLAAFGQFESAERAFKRAIQLDSLVYRAHEGLARVYMATERPVDALRAARSGLDVDPYSTQARRELALALSMNNRCEESLELLAPLKSLQPPARVAGVVRGLCFAKQEKWSDAIAEFQWAAEGGDARIALAFLAFAKARSGDRVGARRILDDMEAERRVSNGAFGIAVVYTGLRDYDRAFLWLDRATREGSVRDYLWDPLFADLQRDARFAAIRQGRRFRADSAAARNPGAGR